MKEIQRKRKDEGLCPHCGKVYTKDSKFVNCDECREKMRKSGKAWKAKTGYNAKLLEQMTSLYHIRKSKGLCVRCGKVNATAPYVTCDKCRNMYNRQRRENRQRRNHETKL